MSESDFMDMSRNGALCNASGEIGAREFEAIMRGEVVTYIQVRRTDVAARAGVGSYPSSIPAQTRPVGVRANVGSRLRR